ncbi:LolA family protein [Tundrisphaera lichenicola]|uniref:LolA family protein n=1 Tax=Tundrisphaera lichenicola TaxID=2029860 RepID=UPI003EC114E1
MKRLAVAVTLSWLLLALPSMADEPGSPAISPEARSRLDALIAAYRALPAYADQGEVALVVKVGDRALTQSRKASVAFARPNRLDVRTDFVRVVSDGTSLTSIVVPLKSFQTVPVPSKFTESSLRGGPLGSIEFGNVEGLPLLHVLNLVVGDEPERLIQDFTPNIRVEIDQEVGGIAYRVLRLDESDNHDWRFLIDPKSGLLAFIDLVVEGDATRSSIAGGDTHIESLRWTAGKVSTEAPAAKVFAFEPGAGFRRIEKLEGPNEAKAEGDKK